MFEYMGFAWVDPDGRLRITSAGMRFIRGRRLEALMRVQLRKLQLWNPGAVEKLREFRLLPHIFLLQMLLKFKQKGISRDEYILFVCRARSHDDLKVVAEYIRKYRRLGPLEREELKRQVAEKRARKGKSPYRAAWLDYAYAVSFLGFPNYVQIGSDRVAIAPRHLATVRSIVQEFEKKGIYIAFRNEREWLSFYGDVNFRNSVDFAYEYYENISDLGNLMELLEDSKAKHLAGSTRKERTVREAILEQYLEVEPERLEHGLVKVKRQLPTAVGPIDILAKDKKGAHVVIELKKGRTSDRVLGQILRYMAWVGENLRNKKPVRGIIVAEKADKGLKYAMRVARKSGIGLKRYQFEINFWDV